jgi:hypothetical protein
MSGVGAIETALKAWASAASGLLTDRVMMSYDAYQGGERPVGGPFITIRMGVSARMGALDTLHESFDATRAAGKEFKLQVLAQRDIGVIVECWGGLPSGDGSAYSILETLRARTRLPSVRALLTNANVSPYSMGAVGHNPYVEGTKYESRAMLSMNIYACLTDEEYVGYFSTAELETKVDSVTGATVADVEVDIDLEAP